MPGYRDTLAPGRRPSYDRAMTAAALVLGRGRSRRDSLGVEDAAREAYVPGGPPVEQIAALIREHRALAAAARGAAA